MITESLLLALVAGAAGTLLALWGAEVLVALTPADVIRLAETGIDRGVLAFTLAVTLVTSVLFGLVPALHASRVDLIDALKQEGARSATSGRAIRTRGVLVVSEIALAVVLLTGAGLLMKSLMALHNVELGYQPANALVMKATGVRSTEENNAFFREVLSRIAALPGVVAVGAAMVPPGDLSNSGSGAYFIDRVPETRDRTKDPFAYYNVVTPGVFAAAGIPLRSGRDFNDGDIAGRPMVAIVNEELVRRSFGGAEPDRPDDLLQFRFEGGHDHRGCGRRRAPAQSGHRPAAGLLHAVHAARVQQPHAACDHPNARRSHRARGDRAARGGGRLSGRAGVVHDDGSDAVERRRRAEIPRAVVRRVCRTRRLSCHGGCLRRDGVRRATALEGDRSADGAGRQQASVLRLILGQGLVLAAVGLAVGLAAAVAATRLLTTVLFEVQPLDIQVYLGVVILLGLLTLVAGYFPARRAAIVDPMEVLKAN